MPIVNREVERAIVERARQRGMPDDQIKAAVLKYRAEAPQLKIGAPTATPAQTPVTPEPKNNLLTSLAKPFLRGATNVLNVGEGIGKLASGQAVGDSATRSRDFGIFGQNIRPVGVSDEGKLKSVGGFAKDVVGTGLEIGSYAAPGAVGVGSKVLKPGAVAANMTINKAAPTIKSFVKGGTLAGGSGALGSSLQEDQSFGKTVAQTAGGALLGGVTGGALPVAGTMGRKIAEATGNLGAQVLGKSTGAGEAAIREAFNNPSVTKFAKQAAKDGPEGLMTQALEDAQRGLKKLRSNRGAAYETELTKIKADKRQLDSLLQDARKVGRGLLESSGVKIKEGKILNTLNFEESTIERGQGTVQKAFNDVMKWRDTTPAGLDKLKKKLSQHLDEIPATERGGAYSFVLDLKNAVSDRLKTDVDGYASMTAKYSEATDLIDEIQRALSLKDTAAKDTAVRKLMSTMRQNNELRKEMLEVLSRAGGQDITGKIAGATLAPWTPRGLSGTAQSLIGPTGIGVSFLTPQAIPFFLLYLATSSPRLMAEAVALLGQVKGRAIPPQIQKALTNLLIQAEREGMELKNE